MAGGITRMGDAGSGPASPPSVRIGFGAGAEPPLPAGLDGSSPPVVTIPAVAPLKSSREDLPVLNERWAVPESSPSLVVVRAPPIEAVVGAAPVVDAWPWPPPPGLFWVKSVVSGVFAAVGVVLTPAAVSVPSSAPATAPKLVTPVDHQRENSKPPRTSAPSGQYQTGRPVGAAAGNSAATSAQSASGSKSDGAAPVVSRRFRSSSAGFMADG